MEIFLSEDFLTFIKSVTVFLRTDKKQSPAQGELFYLNGLFFKIKQMKMKTIYNLLRKTLDRRYLESYGL